MRLTHRCRTAMTVVGLAGALSLAGCGFLPLPGGDDAADPTTASQEETHGSSDEPSASKDSSDDSSSKASEKASATAAPAPDGYTEITTPTTGITFAIPEDWTDLSTLSDEERRQTAEDHGMTIEDLDDYPRRFDLVVFAPEAENGITGHLAVAKKKLPRWESVSETDISEILEGDGATVASYETVQTANGECIRALYTFSDDGVEIHGVLLALPNSEQEKVAVFITTSSSDRSKEIADVVVQTVH